MLGYAEGGARHRARSDEADEELLLVALQIGEASENRHEQSQDERRHRLGVAPGDDHRRAGLGQRREVNRDQRRRKHDERGVSHVVENPASLLLAQTPCVPRSHTFPDRP